MPKSYFRVDLFGEDRAHEAFITALLHRLGLDEQMTLDIRPVMTRGGAGRALTELRAFQTFFAIGQTSGTPDILVVVIDANGSGYASRRAEVEAQLDPGVFPRWAIGCPDPHIERWYCCDPPSFRSVVGAIPTPQLHVSWKNVLAEAVMRGHVTSLDDGIDLAPDLVDAMDLHRARSHDPSFNAFVDELVGALRLARLAVP